MLRPILKTMVNQNKKKMNINIIITITYCISMALIALTNQDTKAPEPALILLFGSGLAGLAGLQIRQRKKS